MFIVDTNVVSELRKAAARTADQHVVDWANSVPAALLFVSVVTIHELEQGVLLVERQDQTQGRVLRVWLDENVIPAFADRIIDVDLRVVRRAARLHVPDPAPFRDALIGASALVHGMTLATRNVRDFQRFDRLDVTNPWMYGA